MTEIVECTEKQAEKLVADGGRVLEWRSVWGDPKLRCLVQKAAADAKSKPEQPEPAPEPVEDDEGGE